MKTKYRVWHRSPTEIEVVEVVRETDKSVTFLSNGSEWNRRKRSQWENFFDTWKEAQDYLIRKAEDRVRQARLELDRAKGHLGNVKGMKTPELEKVVEAAEDLIHDCPCKDGVDYEYVDGMPVAEISCPHCGNLRAALAALREKEGRPWAD